MIPYACQTITQTDIDAVTDVLKSDFLTQGPQVPRFEACVAHRVAGQYAIAVNSATSALHIACLALELGAGDWLWTTPITFVASANCAVYCGAQVDFVDIDPDTFNMSVTALRIKLVNAEKSGKLPKIVIPVHMAGQSCDMRAIYALSEKYGFRIIEDASHAIGGQYEGAMIGSCRHSDITIFSFHPVKIITTAEGGMAVTNQPDLAQRMRLYRNHGITRDAAAMTQPPDGNWYYQQIALGYNYRMTELQAALGISQMQRLEEYVARRHQLADRYDALFKDVPLKTPFRSPASYSAFHLYIIRLDSGPGYSRETVFDHLCAAGIGVNVHYIPVHTQPYYARLGSAAGYDAQSFPEANRYYQQAISLPMYAALSDVQQDDVVEALKQVLL